MKAWLVVATWLCCCILLGSARVYPSTENGDIGEFGYPIVSLATDTVEESVYSTFINNLRKQLQSGAESYLIPLLRSQVPVTSDQRFILAQLSNPQRSTTLLIDVINVYLLGFRAGDYSYYFNDTSNDIYNLHPLQAKNKARLPFNSSYPALENYGAFREQTTLGITQLNEAVFTFNKFATHEVTAAQVAHYVLVAIQMVSEAARFKYIEDQLVDDFFYLDPKRGDLISLQNKWEDISFAIQRSKDGTFDRIQLQDKEYKVFYVSTVAEVKPKIALLLYLATSSQSWGYNGDTSNKLLSML
ncbi:ribosome-inactivating protein gelonin [Ricinus communis]|uniref:rRNA N-glycosylase n=1 Tax=Ricinus communis TaxID=3988 RepID=B9S6M3_RICCO|nr:ribosome-inactivating protein gelonin [Ricinus communis]XP_048233652.1 ribosome-inactivating protein gelonin [Ricinus communis]EEF40749.1 ricin-agglutinin family protein [Ricinus communis]|eukprot:XP_002521642.1 ribosome-inactivating protein gelonin [Ricinus communis]